MGGWGKGFLKHGTLVLKAGFIKQWEMFQYYRVIF